MHYDACPLGHTKIESTVRAASRRTLQRAREASFTQCVLSAQLRRPRPRSAAGALRRFQPIPPPRRMGKTDHLVGFATASGLSRSQSMRPLRLVSVLACVTPEGARRVGVHADDVVEEANGNLMRDGVNIVGRLPMRQVTFETVHEQRRGQSLSTRGELPWREVDHLAGASIAFLPMSPRSGSVLINSLIEDEKPALIHTGMRRSRH